MYLIVGLGNPSREYNNTRHNIGFDAIDMLAEKLGIKIDTAKFKSLIGTGYIEGEKVILMKPQTFMNLSGEAVRAAIDFYKLDPETSMTVICDDIYLDVGRLRIRKKGSAGGHNGIKNIILHTGTEGFSRIRIGVGDKLRGQDLAKHVLGHFTQDERKTENEALEKVSEAVKLMVSGDIDKAMNLYNTKKEPKDDK